MKLSEFVLTHTERDRYGFPKRYFADVTVTKGALFWKKVMRRKISREVPGNWYFIDTGEFTPQFQAERLERAYKAREALREL